MDPEYLLAVDLVSAFTVDAERASRGHEFDRLLISVLEERGRDPEESQRRLIKALAEVAYHLLETLDGDVTPTPLDT